LAAVASPLPGRTWTGHAVASGRPIAEASGEVNPPPRRTPRRVSSSASVSLRWSCKPAHGAGGGNGTRRRRATHGRLSSDEGKRW